MGEKDIVMKNSPESTANGIVQVLSISPKFRLAEDDCTHAEGPASGNLQGWVGFHLRGSRLQSGADAQPGEARGSIRISQGRSVSAGRKKPSDNQTAEPKVVLREQK